MLCPSSASQQHPGAFRTLSLTAIDASIKWWHGKPAPRASALRAPWSLSPNLQSQLKKFLRQWHLQMLDHQVPCHTPSFKTVFIKHAAVLDILCNTNKPLRTGRRPIQQSAVANSGQATKLLHSILQILTGYYPVLFSTRYFHRNLP